MWAHSAPSEVVHIVTVQFITSTFVIALCSLSMFMSMLHVQVPILFGACDSLLALALSCCGAHSPSLHHFVGVHGSCAVADHFRCLRLNF